MSRSEPFSYRNLEDYKQFLAEYTAKHLKTKDNYKVLFKQLQKEAATGNLEANFQLAMLYTNALLTEYRNFYTQRYKGAKDKSALEARDTILNAINQLAKITESHVTAVKLVNSLTSDKKIDEFKQHLAGITTVDSQFPLKEPSALYRHQLLKNITYHLTLCVHNTDGMFATTAEQLYEGNFASVDLNDIKLRFKHHDFAGYTPEQIDTVKKGLAESEPNSGDARDGLEAAFNQSREYFSHWIMIGARLKALAEIIHTQDVYADELTRASDYLLIDENFNNIVSFVTQCEAPQFENGFCPDVKSALMPWIQAIPSALEAYQTIKTKTMSTMAPGMALRARTFDERKVPLIQQGAISSEPRATDVQRIVDVRVNDQAVDLASGASSVTVSTPGHKKGVNLKLMTIANGRAAAHERQKATEQQTDSSANPQRLLSAQPTKGQNGQGAKEEQTHSFTSPTPSGTGDNP